MSQQQEQLDRKELAVSLRGAGYDIDFEDWDGLSDDQVYSKIGKAITYLDERGGGNEI